MNNVEQTLRLLHEVQRVADEGEEGNKLTGISPAALLRALEANDFNLTAAIVDVRSGT